MKNSFNPREAYRSVNLARGEKTRREVLAPGLGHGRTRLPA